MNSLSRPYKIIIDHKQLIESTFHHRVMIKQAKAFFQSHEMTCEMTQVNVVRSEKALHGDGHLLMKKEFCKIRLWLSLT